MAGPGLGGPRRHSVLSWLCYFLWPSVVHNKACYARPPVLAYYHQTRPRSGPGADIMGYSFHGNSSCCAQTTNKKKGNCSGLRSGDLYLRHNEIINLDKYKFTR